MHTYAMPELYSYGPVFVSRNIVFNSLDVHSATITSFLRESLVIIITQSMGKAVTFHTPHTPFSCSRRILTARSSVKTLQGTNLSLQSDRPGSYPLTGRVRNRGFPIHPWVCNYDYIMKFLQPELWLTLYGLNYQAMYVWVHVCVCLKESKKRMREKRRGEQSRRNKIMDYVMCYYYL